MNWDNIDLTALQGWICPKCGRVYSPITPMCYYCGGEQITTFSEGTALVINADHKTEPQKTCDTCKYWKYIAHEWQCETTKCQGYTPKIELQTKRSE